MPAFFCSCGKRFNKHHYFSNHITECKTYIKTDGTFEFTPLKNKLYGWTMFADDLLNRCPKQKIFEANLMLNMPSGSSFLDIGANFGDTACSLAIFAKTHDRNDIRFFVFEPNKLKCDYISKISKLNDLNIHIFPNCVGNNNNFVSEKDSSESGLGCCVYEEKSNSSIKTILLDDIKNEIEPVGFMHIDVEGWEPKVLNGAQSILNNCNNKIILFAECWDKNTSIRLGFSNDPEKSILNELKHHNYERLEDYIEMGEKNLVFKIN